MGVEKIVMIETIEDDNGKSGFIVTTTEQDISLLIDSIQDCCESWGYFWCNDDVKEFVGAELYGVSITDTALNTKIVEREGADSRDEGDIMFVNLETNKGKLQFVAYNCHNGYYGHEAIVECKQLSHSQWL